MWAGPTHKKEKSLWAGPTLVFCERCLWAGPTRGGEALEKKDLVGDTLVPPVPR